MLNKTIYETLGIKHVINARGNQTLLGGSLLPKKVQMAKFGSHEELQTPSQS